jgi:hypothetical protein
VKKKISYLISSDAPLVSDRVLRTLIRRMQVWQFRAVRSVRKASLARDGVEVFEARDEIFGALTPRDAKP